MTYKKVFSVETLLLIIFSFFGIVIFIENFVASSDFDFLSFRCVDDVAFQSTLREMHTQKNFAQFVGTVDYGYGSIFWIPIAIATYPAFLLQQASGIDCLLIVIPRMFSLFYSLGGVYLMYQLVKIYTSNKFIIFTSTLLFPLFPSMSYFSGRFGTIPQVCFFSILSVYLLARQTELTRTQLRIALIVYAAALGTKLSAIILAPVILLLIFSRYNFKFTKDNFKLWIPEALLFGVETLFFISPVFFMPFYSDALITSAKIIGSNLLNTAGGNATFISNVKMVFKLYNVKVTAVLLVLLFFGALKFFKKDERRFDFSIYFIGFIIASVYLSFSITQGGAYILNYLMSIAFVLPLGLVVLDFISLKWVFNATIQALTKKIAVLGCCFILVFAQTCQIRTDINNEYHINPLKYYQDNIKNLNDKLKASEMRHTIIANSDGLDKICIVSDYPIWVFYSPLKHPNIEFWVNWAELQKWNYTNPNFIALDKNNSGLYSNEKFAEILNQNPDKADALMEDRELRQNLIENNIYYDRPCEIVYDVDSYIIFKVTYESTEA